jgi:hypothetical protein
MIHRMLAELVLLLHAAFVAFVLLGGFVLPRWPRLAWLHVPAVAWGAGIAFLGTVCPLTPLENELRRLAGEEGYTGGFVEHYLLGLLYPDGLTRGVQAALGIMVLSVNAAAYARFWRRRKRGRAARPTPP